MCFKVQRVFKYEAAMAASMRGRGALAALLLPLSVSLLFWSALAEDFEVRTYHIPDVVTPEDEVTVYIEVENQSSVRKVWLTLCQLEPYLCFLPREMAYVGSNTFALNIGKFPAGQELKYNITIQMRDGTNHTTPDTHFSVSGPDGGDGGWNNTTNRTGGPARPVGRSPLHYWILGGAMIATGIAIYPLRKRRRAVAGALALLAILAVIEIYLVLTTPTGAVQAPGFRLKDVSGAPLNLSDYRGKVVLLELTAINCPACNIVLDEIARVRARYNTSELVVISVFVSPIETEEQVREYREAHGADWPFARDTDDMVRKYAVVQIPKIVIIDRKGEIVFEAAGEVSESEMIRHINDALAGGGASGVTAVGSLLASVGLAGMAALAGAASFFSPCSFPMLPGYMTFYLKSTGRDTSYKKAAAGGSVAALGIMTVYMSTGAIVIGAGGAALPYLTLLQPVMGAVLIALGALLLLPISFGSGKLLERIQGAQEGKGFYTSMFLYGMGYAAASQGCTAPVFVAVLLLGLLSGSLLVGAGVLLLYSLVAAVLMVMITLLVAGLHKSILNRLKASTEIIKKLSGIVLIIVGVYLVVYYLWAFIL